MRASLSVAVVLLAAATILSGCTSSIKLDRPPAQKVIIEPGKLTVDGKESSVPYDAWYTFEAGLLVPHTTGFKLEPLIGIDLVGLNFSPWAGLRFFHLEAVGLDFGFDRENFTCGLDWLWHDLTVGPNIAFPYDLTREHFGIKAGFIF